MQGVIRSSLSIVRLTPTPLNGAPVKGKVVKILSLCRIFLSVTLASFLILVTGLVWADCPPNIAGAVYRVNVNNDSPSIDGTFTIANNCLSGQVEYSGVAYSVLRMKVSSPNRFGSREISFMRNDAYRQYYNGWISSDGNLITGYLINVNNNITSIEKFPFYAMKP